MPSHSFLLLENVNTWLMETPEDRQDGSKAVPWKKKVAKALACDTKTFLTTLLQHKPESPGTHRSIAATHHGFTKSRKGRELPLPSFSSGVTVVFA